MAARIQRHFDFPISLSEPYKLCDFRPAFGEMFREELVGYDFWGHCDLDVVFGQIRDHLPPDAWKADKILIQGNFALYRNTPEAAEWFRHEIDGISYRDVFTRPEAMHFDEWAGIRYILDDLGVSDWQDDVIFDLSFARYRTRAEHPPGRDPRRYAWEDGEICEYRLAVGTSSDAPLCSSTCRSARCEPPDRTCWPADRYWILANGFAVQRSVSRRAIRAARIPAGREIVPHYVRRVQRSIRRRAARRAAAREARVPTSSLGRDRG